MNFAPKALQPGREQADKAKTKPPAIAGHEHPISIECVQSDKRFAQLANDWQHLDGINGDGFAVFQSFDWCSKWWHTVGQFNPDARLKIMVLWHGEKLVAIWPLMQDLLPLGTKALLPLTSPHAEYSNLIFDPAFVDQAALAHFVGQVLDQFEGDLVSLAKIPQGSALQLALGDKGALAPTDEIASIFDLSQFESFEQYQASLSKSTRRNRNKRKNKLARLGNLTYQTHFADAPEYAQLVATALHMKRDWLRRTARNDAKLIMDGLTQCISTLEGNSKARSGAVAGALMLDGQPVAVEIGLLQHGHYYSYIGAFDWEMREHSVGKIQIEEALKWAIECGVKNYDLLAEPAGYKDSWSNNQVALQTRVVASSARGFLVGIMWQTRVRPVAKSVFNQLPNDWRQKIIQLVHSLRGTANHKAS
jgi:CelD/BcsL family acetyltransferase involved in cellulose biosynthesis